MAEYIEREAEIESFRKNLDGGYVLTNDAQTTHILQSLPAADVRPVVLCRDCKYWELSKIYPSFHVCTYVYGATFVRKAEDFCSRGKKREES